MVELHDAFTIAELLYYEALGPRAPRRGRGPAALRRHATGRTRAGQPQRRAARQGPPAGRHGRRADGGADVAAAGSGRRTPGRGRQESASRNAPAAALRASTMPRPPSTCWEREMSDNRFDPEHVAVVTGAARGIGLGIATPARRAGSHGRPARPRWRGARRRGRPPCSRRAARPSALAVDLTDSKAVDAAFAASSSRRAGRVDHPRQQRGRGARHALPEDERRGLGPGHRLQPAIAIPLLPRGAAGHGGARLRPHRQPLVARLARRLRPGQLLGGQGRRGEPDAQPGDRVRRQGRDRQRGGAGHRRHAAVPQLRAGSAGAAQGIGAGAPHRHGGRHRAGGGVLPRPGGLLCDRPDACMSAAAAASLRPASRSTP